MITTTRTRPRHVAGALAGVAAIALGLAGTVSTAHASTSQPDAGRYRFVDSTEAYGPAAGPFTSIATTGEDIGNHCDDCVTPITLPFPVDLYDDQGVTQLNASSNGDLQAHSASTWPGVQQPNGYMDGAIQPFHADLRTDLGGAILTETSGTAPHRQFTVEWRANDVNDVSSFAFQTVFFEGSREIQFRYLQMTAPTLGHSTGIQGGDGSGNRATIYSDFGRRISDGLAVSFRRTDTAVALTGSSPTSVVGQKVTLTARVTRIDRAGGVPTGSVVFTDGATTIGTAKLDARGTAVLKTAALPVGYHELVATHVGTTGGSGRQFLDVRRATTTTTVTAPATASYGTALQAKVRVLAPGTGSPAGSVRWLDDDSEIASTPLAKGVATLPPTVLAPGEHHLRAVLDDDGQYAGSSSDVTTVTVVRATPAVSLVVSPNPVTRGKKAKLTATVRGISGAAQPTGTITFTDGDVLLGAATLDATGRATLTWMSSAAGSHTLRATYGGDERYDGQAAPVEVTVQ